MEVGFADNQDIDSWCALVEKVKRYFPGLEMESYRKSLQASIARSEALVVTDSDNHVAGALIFSSKTAELMFLAVDPACRKQGIATALVKKMVSLFPVGSKIYVVTYHENDPLGKDARELYRKIGFKEGKLITVFNYPCQEFYYVVPV